MSCDDLDRLRTERCQTASSDWPDEANKHLESCERCSRLQAALESATSPDFPAELYEKIERAILTGLQPVSPLPSAWRLTLALLVCSSFVIAIANGRLGIAGWEARNRLQTSVDFGLLAVGLLALANAVSHQMSPGYRHRAPAWLYIAGPLAVFLAADAALFGYLWNRDFFPIALSCWKIGVTCAALSAPLFWLVLRKGFSLHPMAYGAMTGLLAGLTGLTVLELYCPYLDRLHISAAHLGAALTSALVGAGLGAIKHWARPGPA
jgi:hypothetical protein